MQALSSRQAWSGSQILHQWSLRHPVPWDRVAIQEMDAASHTFCTLDFVNPCGRRSQSTKRFAVPPLASLCPLAIKVLPRCLHWTQRPWSISQIQVCLPPTTAQPRLEGERTEWHRLCDAQSSSRSVAKTISKDHNWLCADITAVFRQPSEASTRT